MGLSQWVYGTDRGKPMFAHLSESHRDLYRAQARAAIRVMGGDGPESEDARPDASEAWRSAVRIMEESPPTSPIKDERYKRGFDDGYDNALGLREDLEQLIRVCLTNPGDIRGFIEANYPREYQRYVSDPTAAPDLMTDGIVHGAGDRADASEEPYDG